MCGEDKGDSARAKTQLNPGSISKQDHAEQYSLWQTEKESRESLVDLILDSYLHALLSIETDLDAIAFS